MDWDEDGPRRSKSEARSAAAADRKREADRERESRARDRSRPRASAKELSGVAHLNEARADASGYGGRCFVRSSGRCHPRNLRGFCAGFICFLDVWSSIDVRMYIVTPTTITARFSALLGIAGLDLFELDRLAGFGRSGLASQINRGVKLNPRVSTIKKYAAVLGCSVMWLLLGEGPEPSERTVRGAVKRARTAVRRLTTPARGAARSA